MRSSLFIASAALLLALPAAAQTTAGRWLATGSLSLQSNTTEQVGTTNTANSFTFSPAIGRFVAPHLALGIGGGFGTSKQRVEYNNYQLDTKSTSYSVSLFGRYYAMVSEKVGFTGTLAPQFARSERHDDSWSNVNSSVITTTQTSKGYGVYLTPGFVYLPLPRFSLDVNLGSFGYQHTTATQTTGAQPAVDYTVSGFEAALGLRYLSVGATVFFGGN